ncbi:hypothetical protein [Nitrincola sp.]|uniref:hypothetical protein n=1 Tax=Nitrincola sp. TaxID=1926584 RepID=UPI003A94E729
MTWGNKDHDWKKLISDIQSEIDANKDVIPKERLSNIQYYLDHDEYSMAFEYLYLEIMEREGACFTLGKQSVKEIALFFDLNDENECMVDARFWPKLQAFLERN